MRESDEVHSCQMVEPGLMPLTRTCSSSHACPCPPGSAASRLAPSRSGIPTASYTTNTSYQTFAVREFIRFISNPVPPTLIARHGRTPIRAKANSISVTCVPKTRQLVSPYANDGFKLRVPKTRHEASSSVSTPRSHAGRNATVKKAAQMVPFTLLRLYAVTSLWPLPNEIHTSPDLVAPSHR